MFENEVFFWSLWKAAFVNAEINQEIAKPATQDQQSNTSPDCSFDVCCCFHNAALLCYMRLPTVP